MIDWLIRLLVNFFMGFVNIFRALANPSAWLDWTDKNAMVSFIYYGGSVEFLFVVLDIFIVLLVIGLYRRAFLWGLVRAMEGFANAVGRFAAWAALLMVLQQIMIVLLQRIFKVSEISIGPVGTVFTRDLSWYAEELKLYNAMIVALCAAYTFVQGGHVRVDLFYAGMRHRGKRIIDVFGSILFVLPVMVLTWKFSWFFLWRHLVTPKFAASDTLELMERKSRLLKWNVETIGFSPNGFDAYFLFKVLLVTFAGMMFVQGITFFYRSLLEFLEGVESAGKYQDKDNINDEVAEAVAAIH